MHELLFLLKICGKLCAIELCIVLDKSYYVYDKIDNQIVTASTPHTFLLPYILYILMLL